jgi:ABC-type polysaccharide/polyol phosphate transport system ATPase subunit
MLSEQTLPEALRPASGVLSPRPEPAIVVQHVSKHYRRYPTRTQSLKGRVLDWLQRREQRYVDFDAVSDVSFEVPHGQMVAIVGQNGAGKSTLLRILARVVEPDRGTIALNGRVSPLLELGAGFSPELSGRRNVFLYGALLGLSRREIVAQLPSIIDFSEIGDFIDSPVKHYSTGMYVRLAFAVTAHLNPDILLLDEVLAVGDAAYQRKCKARMEEFKRDGKTIVLVSHDGVTVSEMCDRALLLHKGSLLDDNTPDQIFSRYYQLITTR